MSPKVMKKQKEKGGDAVIEVILKDSNGHLCIY